MRTTLAVALMLLVSAPVLAQDQPSRTANDASEFCQKAGPVGSAIADERDANPPVTLEEALNHLNKRYNTDRRHDSERLVLGHLIIQRIYGDSKMNEEQAAQFAIKTCIDHYLEIKGE